MPNLITTQDVPCLHEIRDAVSVDVDELRTIAWICLGDRHDVIEGTVFKPPRIEEFRAVIDHDGAGRTEGSRERAQPALNVIDEPVGVDVGHRESGRILVGRRYGAGIARR
jgi:hypothetical protein